MIEVHDEGVRFFRAALIGCAASVPLWLLLIGAFYLACGGESRLTWAIHNSKQGE